MSFVNIKKIQKPHPATGDMQEWYAVPCVSISTPQGKKLIPNPSGHEAELFATLQEAEEAVKRAGFDYEYEGRKSYALQQTGASLVAPGAATLEASVPVLVARLKEREPAVVANAAFALGMLKATEAIPALCEILGHQDPGVRQHVAGALARLGWPSVSFLETAFQQALQSKEAQAPYVRLTVMNTYLELVQSQPEWRERLLQHMMPQLLQGLEDESWLVRSQAALVIGHAANEPKD